MPGAAMLDIDSPEDFSNSALASLDRALRCTICQDFFQAPVLLTGCSHSFCSRCLRDHLSLPGQDSCPSCSVKASDSHIKRVPAIEEVVTRWKEARPALLDLLALQIAQSTASTSKVPNDKVNGKKRKLDSPVVESSKKKGKSRAVESDSDIEEIVDPTNPKAVVACPVCQETMRNEQMMSHLERAHPEPKKDKGKGKKGKNDVFGTMMEGGGAKAKKKSNVDLTKRLSKPIYRLLDLQSLRDQLMDIDLFEPKRDKALSKEQLEARHKHYVNLHNANLDASEQHRKPLKELRAQVMQSEKQAATPARDLDLKEHEKKNRGQFAELEKRMRARQASTSKHVAEVEEQDLDRSAPLTLKVEATQEESIASSDSSDAEGGLEGLISDEEIQVDQLDPFQLIVEPAELEEEEEERDLVPELETKEEKMRLSMLSPFDWPAPRASQRDKSERPIVV